MQPSPRPTHPPRSEGEAAPSQRPRASDLAAKHTISLDVTIMGREFRVVCPEDEKESLLQAVSFLDRRMREIREKSKAIGLERIAIMAALNIAHDYLAMRSQMLEDSAARSKLAHLNKLLDAALAQPDNLA